MQPGNNRIEYGIIEYNMIQNVQNVVRKLVPDTFMKIKIEHISGPKT